MLDSVVDCQTKYVKLKKTHKKEEDSVKKAFFRFVIIKSDGALIKRVSHE